MLRIGITYNPSLDLFYSGANQTSIILFELFKNFDYKVILVDSKNTGTKKVPAIDFADLTQLYLTTDLDYLIDIDGFIDPSVRKAVAKKSIVFMRTFLQFNEMDNSVYPDSPYKPRSFDGVSEIWCWDILNPKETLDSIQTLFPCPIRTVPFIWSQTIVSAYTSHTLKYDSAKPFEVHIAEKNSNNSSSSIIPLVAVRELHNNNKSFNAVYKCHNMDRIIENKFLKENVLNNIEISKLPIKFVPKDHFYEWLSSENIIMLSHSRFTPFRIGLLNALWLGIPVIHNSTILKEVHPMFSTMFYFGNSISGMSDCFSRFCSGGIADFISSVDSIRSSILEKWSIAKNLKGWEQICSSLSLSSPSVASFSLSPLPVASLSLSSPTIASVVPVTPTSNKNSIIIAFSDMWPGFNYNNNFIIDSLRYETKSLSLDIIGINYTADSNPNLLIFGPYSHTWTTVPDTIPKVYFSAENWTKPNDSRIALYITSARNEDDTHIRIPTWMMYIDWYSNKTTLPENCEDNPIRLPIHFAITPHPIIFKNRTEFCGFVVSNPICSLRNETFKAVNDYKKVNSGGVLYNNIGGQLSLKYPGGGCGDISKYQFFSKQQFSISFENSQGPGYITEKVLHAKMAGCVPLYWGDKDTNTDFVNGSIVNLSMFDNPEQILEVIKKLELNPDLCAKIASTPILNQEKKTNALAQISKMSQKLLAIVNINQKPATHLKNIDKVFIINLDTRKDRWKTLCKEEPFITSIAERVSAVNGRTLKLTPYIYSLFRNNNFNWKKSVIGCNLSHINIWTKILSQKSGNLFLILEDDVRFIPSQLSTWDKYAETIPSDAELVYIGGVLPPNRPGLNSVIEPINDFWGKIKPNQLFTGGPLLPLFHFCTYSYIISRRAVEKLIEHLINSENKMPNVIDHFLGFHSLNLKTYVANPLITKCFQDDDPIYQNALFNNTGTIAQFDSDIRNNTECFSEEDIKVAMQTKEVIKVAMQTKEVIKVAMQTKEVIDIIQPADKTLNIVTLYHITDMEMPIYEHNWITDIFSEYTLKKVDNLHNFIEDDVWFIVQRPYLDILNTYFNNLPKNITFKALHLSDEFDKDTIDFYNLPNCKGIIRNYLRPDTPEVPHIITVPLGYHYKGINNSAFLDRKLVWSFHGNCWFDRKSKLEQLYSFVPHNCHTVNEWNASNMSKQNQYLSVLADSKFCPILKGNNIETFRLYEALEVGTIPIYVRHEGDELFWNKISSKLGLLELENWTRATEMIQNFLNNPDEGEKYQIKLCEAWIKWKSEIKSACQTLL